MKKLQTGIIALLLLLCSISFAENSESLRVLIHTLNYLGVDYKNAVADGKVINADEYKEQLEFCENAEHYYHEFSTQWSDSDSAQVGSLIDEITHGVQQKADPQYITEKANEARLKVIAITGFKTYPLQYPDIAQGQKLFIAQCTRCHGNKGFGDGPDGKLLTPKPLNFHDSAYLNDISAAHIFNTVRLGVAGTGMPAYPTLKDDEVWNLSFYILSLRYQNSNANQEGALPEISLEQLATQSDNALRKQFQLNDEQLAALRLKEEKQSKDRFIGTAENYLDQSFDSYQQGHQKQALRLASLAYLEGIEPVELHIKANNPELCEHIEHQFKGIRDLISANRPVQELADSISSAKVSLKQATEILQKKDYSFWMALIMSASILLREGMEALLIILIILSILKASGVSGQMKWIHVGWISAIILGVLLWFISGELINKLGGAEMIEGVISFVAVAVLLYIGFWLHGKTEMSKWTDFVNQKMKNVTSEGSIIGMASLSFFVVFREVFESVLFLSALNVEAAGKQSHAIALGVILAFVVVLIFAYIMVKFSARLPLSFIFKGSMLIMGLLAIVLTGKGIHSFQEISYIPVHGIPFVHISVLGIYPTLETTIGQIIVLIALLLVYRANGKKK